MVQALKGSLRTAFLVTIAVSICLSLVQIYFHANLFSSSQANQVSNGSRSWSEHPGQATASNNITVSRDSKQSKTGYNSNSTSTLLLSVPFYVYEELAWESATWDGTPIADTIYNMSNPKHTDDYWFMKAALSHPMRTLNASEAKLFVIPSLQNQFDSRAFFKKKNLCLQPLCNGKLMRWAGNVVANSSYYQQYPDRHLAVASHFARHKAWWANRIQPPMQSVLWNTHNIAFENQKTNAPNRFSFSKIHVGTSCPLQTNNKTYDVTMIATLKPEDVRFRDRETICLWLHNHNQSVMTTTAGTELAHGKIRVGTCGWGITCPSLAQSILGFHVRGDTPSSSRLFDTLLSGTVPIFTLQEQYQVLPDWIDWMALSYFIDMESINNETEFINQLLAILKDKETLQKKQRLVLDHRHLFDWHTLYPFDMFLYRLQVLLYPETAHDPTAMSSILKFNPKFSKGFNVTEDNT